DLPQRRQAACGDQLRDRVADSRRDAEVGDAGNDRPGFGKMGHGVTLSRTGRQRAKVRLRLLPVVSAPEDFFECEAVPRPDLLYPRPDAPVVARFFAATRIGLTWNALLMYALTELIALHCLLALNLTPAACAGFQH